MRVAGSHIINTGTCTPPSEPAQPCKVCHVSAAKNTCVLNPKAYALPPQKKQPPRFAHVEHDVWDRCRVCIVLTGLHLAVAFQVDLKLVRGVVEARVAGLEAGAADGQHLADLRVCRERQSKAMVCLCVRVCLGTGRVRWRRGGEVSA